MITTAKKQNLDNLISLRPSSAFSFILLGGSFVFNHYLFAIKQMPVEEEQDIDIQASRTGKIF